MTVATVGLTVAILGTLGVLAAVGTRKYWVGAKVCESRNALGQIAKDAAEAHERDGRVCPSASAPIPADVALVRGRKYQSQPGDWEADAARNGGFHCLRFSMAAPQEYQYRYDATETSFVAGARADRNANGRFADFKVRGAVKDGSLLLAPSIEETDPDE